MHAGYAVLQLTLLLLAAEPGAATPPASAPARSVPVSPFRSSIEATFFDAIWEGAGTMLPPAGRERLEEVLEESGYEDLLAELDSVHAAVLDTIERDAYAGFLASPVADSIRSSVWRTLTGTPEEAEWDAVYEEAAAALVDALRDAGDPALATVADKYPALQEAMMGVVLPWFSRFASTVPPLASQIPVGFPGVPGQLSYADVTVEYMGFGSDWDEPPGFVEDVVPRYPFDAWMRGVEADIWVGVRIGTRGEVLEAKTIWIGSEDPYEELGSLIQTAESAAREFRFTPAHREGDPVVSRVVMPFSFSLTER